jgi:hypothetical protein
MGGLRPVPIVREAFLVLNVPAGAGAVPSVGRSVGLVLSVGSIFNSRALPANRSVVSAGAYSRSGTKYCIVEAPAERPSFASPLTLRLIWNHSGSADSGHDRDLCHVIFDRVPGQLLCYIDEYHILCLVGRLLFDGRCVQLASLSRTVGLVVSLPVTPL